MRPRSPPTARSGRWSTATSSERRRRTAQRTRLGVDGDALLSLVGNVPLRGRRDRSASPAGRRWLARARHRCRSQRDPGAGARTAAVTAVGWAPTTTCGACRRTVSPTPPPSPASTSAAATSSPSPARQQRSFVAVPARWSGSTGVPARSSRTSPRPVAADATLSVTATVDLVWVDDVAGDFVWGVNPWGIQAIEKDAEGILVLGDDGDIVESGEPGQSAAGADDGAAREPEVREPDDNGIDDPPVAVDDPVTARSGASVPVAGHGQRLRPRRRGDRCVVGRCSGPRLGRHRHGDDGRVHTGARLRRHRRVRLHDRRRQRHAPRRHR